MDSREIASCGGMATRTRAPGSSEAGLNTRLPCLKATATSGTEPPSNSNLITDLTTADIGKWTSTSENPLPRCPPHTSSSSGPRLGILSLITGTFTKEKKLNNPLMTKPHKHVEHTRRDFWFYLSQELEGLLDFYSATSCFQVLFVTLSSPAVLPNLSLIKDVYKFSSSIDYRGSTSNDSSSVTNNTNSITNNSTIITNNTTNTIASSSSNSSSNSCSNNSWARSSSNSHCTMFSYNSIRSIMRVGSNNSR